MTSLLKPLTLAAILFAAILAPAAAQHDAPLTLAEAIELALRANPALRAAASEVAAKDGALAQAKALPNPELEVLREGQRRERRATTAQLSIPFELGGKRAARADAAREERGLAALALADLRVQVRADTSAAFYELAAAIERHRMDQELAALAARAAEAAAKRVEAGKVSPVDETRARVAQAGARIEVIQAARNLESARIRLAALWGGEGASLQIALPAGDLPPAVPLPQLAARLDQAPAMQRARAQLRHREALAQVERTRRIPDVTLIVGARREGLDERDQAVVGVSLPLPLFNRNQGALLEALRRVDKARDEEEAERVRLQSELAQAHARLRAALEESALIAAEILPGAESAYRAASRGAELGKFGILDVLDAQRTLFQSKTQYLNAAAESHRAAADIARLTGTSAVQETP
ncbi:TolC family protein [Massilia sp. ZL223]|uniref:TolC family protein n=1 Tax=Massilia sp. ZL223 TaxID=2824904 RepID=UPI001B81B986|nr:TolC family protein [Massilia sp. ZL223]MBQ5962353.1 TolC family protein [Massilia sp. ZL223]